MKPARTEQPSSSHYYLYDGTRYENKGEVLSFFRMGSNTFRRKVKRGEIKKIIINQESFGIENEKETKK